MQVERLEQFIALAVVGYLFGQRVYGSINFDDQPRLMAVEISDELPDRMLPPELSPIKLMPPQRRPEPFLHRSRLAPHLPGRISRIHRTAS
jgi:hypothetical protein